MSPPLSGWKSRPRRALLKRYFSDFYLYSGRRELGRGGTTKKINFNLEFLSIIFIIFNDAPFLLAFPIYSRRSIFLSLTTDSLSYLDLYLANKMKHINPFLMAI